MKPLIIRSIPRERDDQLLLWLQARLRGISCSQIARIRGVAPETVQITIKKIKDAGLRESGENPVEVLKWYR
jgi:hypothetical protein